MIIELDLSDKMTAENILDVQIPSYKVEAEIIGFYGIPQLKDTVETIQQSDETFLGYYINKELVGAIAYTRSEKETDICRLIVHPNHFRKGIARNLVKHLLEHVVGGEKVVVSTGAKNEPAKNLYKSFGFTEIKDIEVAPGVEITLFEMIKSNI